MHRRASVLATVVMAPSLVDYTVGKAKKERAGLISNTAKSAAPPPARGGEQAAQAG